MKKFLLSLTLLSGFVLFSNTTISQGTGACKLTVSNVQVTIVGDPISETGDKCTVTFNVSFDLSNNSGNKFIFIHSFLSSDYGLGSFDCSKNGAANPPTSATLGTLANQIGKSFFDLALDNNLPDGAVGVPVNLPVLPTYGPDPTVQLTTSGTTATKTFVSGTTNRIIIRNATVTINQSCASELIVKTDIWSSNSNAATAKAQCFTCGGDIISTFNNPTITGRINCAIPRTYDLNITTTSSIDQAISYKVYIDVNNNNTLETVGENQDILVFTSAEQIIRNNNPYGVSGQDYLPYSGQPEYGDKNLLVELTSPTLQNSRLQILKKDPNIECAPLTILPVSYAAFTATRTSNSQVVLEWETAMEENNKGFHVQRNVNGEWKNIGFVFTQANNGNSSSNLKYTFKDANSSKGISQYRILQVDMDGKGRYSEVRSIRGEEMATRLTVFPNPSNTGSFSILFEEGSSVRDVVVSDVSGRAVKQYKGVSNSSLSIDNLGAGFYTVQVLNRTTGAIATEKVIIKKR